MLKHDTSAAVWNGTDAQMYANLAGDPRISSVSLANASWTDFNSAVSTLATKNFAADEMTFHLHPANAAGLRVRGRQPEGDLCCIENGMLAGVKVIESPAVPQGSCFLGIFSRYVVVFWGVEMLVNDVTLRPQGKIRYHIFAQVNSGAIDPAAFLRCSDLS